MVPSSQSIPAGILQNTTKNRSKNSLKEASMGVFEFVFGNSSGEKNLLQSRQFVIKVTTVGQSDGIGSHVVYTAACVGTPIPSLSLSGYILSYISVLQQKLAMAKLGSAEGVNHG